METTLGYAGSLLWESTLGVYCLGLRILYLAGHTLWEPTLLESTVGVYSGSLLWESTLGLWILDLAGQMPILKQTNIKGPYKVNVVWE